MTTDVHELIGDLDGGALESRLSRVLSDVAAGVIDHDGKGSVSVTINLSRIGNSYQVMADAVLKYKRPTSKGEVSETNISETPLYVGKGGRLSLLQEEQGQLFGKKGEVNKQNVEE